MKRLVSMLFILSLLLIGVQAGMLQYLPPNQPPAPTLVPPTPVQQAETGEYEVLPSESAIGRIQASGIVNVGILFNAPPFAELNIRGDLIGYDADMVRAMAEMWDVDVNFVQVTRNIEYAARLLRTGQIDMLVGAQVHRRSYDALIEFSQTYFRAKQSVMVRADDLAAAPLDMNGRSIGVVIGTPAESAIRTWIERNNLSITVRTFYTLDRAHVALEMGEVDGVVDTDYRLRQVSLVRPESVHVLQDAIELEPFAIGVLRQDVGMRDLINRTIQFLTITEVMNDIHGRYFPGEIYDTVLLWRNLGDEEPTPAQYDASLKFPEQYIVPRIQRGEPVRVAGLYGVTADSNAPESERRLDAFHRSLVQEMGSRWGVTVEFVPNSRDNAVELVSDGEADIAVGISPDWAYNGDVDFSGYYLLHGERLMVRRDDAIDVFGDLRSGMTVLTPSNESTAAARAVELAESDNVRIDISQVPEGSLGFSLLVDEEGDAVFGDSLKLIPHVQGEGDLLRLTRTADDSAGRWYSKSVMALATPYNDIDFRLLVDYTLQELVRDGTLNQLLEPLMLAEDMPMFEIWPGSSQYLNFALN